MWAKALKDLEKFEVALKKLDEAVEIHSSEVI
jgi:hypothetical protein